MSRKTLACFLLSICFLSGCAPRSTPQGPAAIIPSAPTPAPLTATPVPTAAAPAATASPAPGLPAPEPDSPRGVVQSFYQWYLRQSNEDIMLRRAFNDRPDLTGIFKSDINYLIDSFADSSGYDPFTCAQNRLPSLEISQVFTSGDEATALAEVRVENKVRHYFVVALDRSETDWKINAITCQNEPRVAALGLYTWYLGYSIGDADAALRPTPEYHPLLEHSYRRSYLISPALVETLDAAGTGGSRVDPILDADGLPVRFSIQDGAAPATVRVRLDFDQRTARYHTLRMIQGPAGWQVDAIEHEVVEAFDPQADAGVDTTGWQLYDNAGYGLHLRFPPGWFVQPASLGGLPKDDPVRAGVDFIAPGLPAGVPALWLRVLESSEAALIAYYPTESHQETRVNGQALWVDRETCNTRYVFPHPSRANTWVVIGDNCPGMDGREKYAAALDGVVAPLLRSMRFD